MKILVAGAGSIGQRHIRIIKNTGLHEMVVCDNNVSYLDYVTKEYGIQHCYQDYREALNNDVQAAFICTPNSLHASMCVDAMARGCNVFVEKPIASSSEEAHEIVCASKKYNRKVMVGYILRVYPGVQDIKRILDEGRLGKVVSARVKVSAPATLSLAKSDYRKSYETGGGIIYDYSHEIDYLRYFFGEIARYSCFKDCLVKKGQTCDDIAEIIIQYQNSVLANIHLDYIQEYGNSGRHIEIIAEKGVIEHDFNEMLVIYDSYGNKVVQNYKFDRDELFTRQLDKFVAICQGEKEEYVGAEDGLEIVKLCEGFYRSDRDRVVITTT